MVLESTEKLLTPEAVVAATFGPNHRRGNEKRPVTRADAGLLVAITGFQLR